VLAAIRSCGLTTIGGSAASHADTVKKLDDCGSMFKRGYSARVTEKVLGANFARVFAATWTADPKACA
jgi:hypothetical protein